MIMIVIPNNKGDAYHAVKKICCVDKPVPTQCVTGTVLKKPKGMMSVATKVAIQMAAKLGAEPWAVNMPLKDTMVIGYDSYHDSTQKGMAVGAVVASLNSTMTKYSSTCTFHHNNEELISQMKVCITSALRKYFDENKKNPNRIIVYRDGVGDGQIEFVREHEIKAMKQVFAEMKLEPKFTYIVVSKRINTKFFRKSGNSATNPPSGTVIDDVVTLPERYDFFLISQSVRQGTVNPTSYNVIEDNSGLRPDHIQKLTYKLTHLYYNWPGTVRVPAPCQYAHKLVDLVGEHIHKQPSPGLLDKLYYL
jgi:aubergine-like protein